MTQVMFNQFILYDISRWPLRAEYNIIMSLLYWHRAPVGHIPEWQGSKFGIVAGCVNRPKKF